MSVENAAVQVTPLIPPGRPPAGTGKASPVRNTLLARPLGTVVTHRLLDSSKLVDAAFTAGSKAIVAAGTARLYRTPLAVKLIVESVRKILAGPEPNPSTWIALLNQMMLPSATGVELNVDSFELDAVHGFSVSSVESARSRRRTP